MFDGIINDKHFPDLHIITEQMGSYVLLFLFAINFYVEIRSFWFEFWFDDYLLQKSKILSIFITVSHLLDNLLLRIHAPTPIISLIRVVWSLAAALSHFGEIFIQFLFDAFLTLGISNRKPKQVNEWTLYAGTQRTEGCILFSIMQNWRGGH